MAPLTRLRGTVDHMPTLVMAEYYRQRASAGLILSEGIPIAPFGVGYPQVPGLWSAAQVEGWKPITAAVHNAGGRIFAQIWHVGRLSDPSFLDGQRPVGPSAVGSTGTVSLLRPQRPYPIPRALELEEIPHIIEQFRQGAENAQAAGFDGVEIHGANGYLLDQFLQDNANLRTDEYGGSIPHRARLHLEVADAAVSVWGPDRVGMHLAPRADAQGMGDSNPEAVFTYLATELGKRKLSFLCAREYIGERRLGPLLKQCFDGNYIANERFDRQTAEGVIARGEADAVAFGKLFIANPDLPKRFAEHLPLNDPHPETFYTHGPKGYIDYPSC